MSEKEEAIEKLRKQWRREGLAKIRTEQKNGSTLLPQEEADRIREWMLRGNILGMDGASGGRGDGES